MFKVSGLDGQALKTAMQMADVAKQIEEQQALFIRAAQTFQDAVQPIQDALQPYQNSIALTGVATALASVASATEDLALDNAVSSMTKTLDTMAVAVRLYQDLYQNQYNPIAPGVLSALETASLTLELQELKMQLELSTQTMGNGLAESLGSLTAVSNYLNTLVSQWDNALAFTNVLERSIAAQNLAVVRMLPNYEKLALPRGGKKVLKSLTMSAAEKLMQSDKIHFDPKGRDFYHEGSPDKKISGDQITVVASSLELFEEFTLDDLISFESQLEENYAFGLQHPVGARINEILKSWNLFVDFEDITYYHARVLGKDQNPYLDSEMMKAPTNVSAHGRYNEVGRSCYYIAEDRDGALKEIYKHSGGTKPRVQVIGLKAKKPVRLLDLSGDISKRANLFIEHMRFTVENDAGKTVREYLLPNYVAACCKDIGIDGIRYRSAGNRSAGYNCCVLWEDDYFEYAEGSRAVIEPDTMNS